LKRGINLLEHTSLVSLSISLSHSVWRVQRHQDIIDKSEGITKGESREIGRSQDIIMGYWRNRGQGEYKAGVLHFNNGRQARGKKIQATRSIGRASRRSIGTETGSNEKTRRRGRQDVQSESAKSHATQTRQGGTIGKGGGGSS